MYECLFQFSKMLVPLLQLKKSLLAISDVFIDLKITPLFFPEPEDGEIKFGLHSMNLLNSLGGCLSSNDLFNSLGGRGKVNFESSIAKFNKTKYFSLTHEMDFQLSFSFTCLGHFFLIL